MDKRWCTRNHQTLIALWILLKLGLCWAFDVHITETEKVGKVLFNSSLGSDWRYSLNSVRSSFAGLKLVGVDSFQGHVVLLSNPHCASLARNPFTVVINARTEPAQPDDSGVWDTSETLRSVQVPLTVHVHGKRCHGPGRRTGGGHLGGRARTRKQVKINVHLGSDHGACIDKKFRILSLSDLIPSYPPNKCQAAKYRLEKNRYFRLDSPDGSVYTARLVCLQPVPHTLHGTITYVCVSGKPLVVPYKIVLSAREEIHSYISADPSMAITLDQGTNKHLRIRARRSADLPTFPQRLYVKNVQEEQGPGLVVGTFTILDPQSHQVTYSLIASRDGRSQNMFTIDSSSGQVSTTQKLDREHILEHFFLVTATNTRNAHESGQATLIIKIEDVNDHAPKFESLTYPHSVSESMSIGATVLTVRASDEDSGPNGEIVYSILNPSGPNEVFRIDPRSGSIYTHGLLDRETVNFYRLHIQASDKGAIPNRQTATAEVEITILDENDNRPQFTQSAYTVDVSEDIDYSNDPVVTVIQAIDRDEGSNAMVRYSITGGNNQNTFAIDAMTGQLSLLAQLDYEKASNYRLVVRAQDSGRPGRSNSTTVLVRVLDVNDNDPRFMPNVFEESVLESDPIGHVIMRVQAYDADAGPNSALLYTIIDAPKYLPIEIDQHSGIMTTNKKLDRETHTRYAFKVEARDQGTPARSATATIEVKIRDVNDNAPIFSPRIYYEIVSEEAFPGTPVVTVTARDADENENGHVTYTISAGNERKVFHIISQMGQGLISVARTLNYKEQSRYILSVTASDPGRLVDTATVFINVSDANTFRPLFQGTPYQIRVDEDSQVGSTVFKVMATDGDVGENARITYSIDDNEAFQINPVSGEILVKHPLDREKVPGYTVSVTAADNGRPSKSDTTDIEITINDVNDNAPVFRQTSYSGRVGEDSIVGTSILTLSAQDIDMGLNGRIRYTFEGGNNGGGDFMLDPTLGILRIAKELDRERMDHYELRALAIDRGLPPKSASVIINVQVEDVNDNAPQFESSKINIDIRENSPIGSTVNTIMADDPDDGVNSEVKYSIVGGTDADSFALRTRLNEPATITTLVELDYESGKTQYSIMVRARSFHLFSDALVVIHVIDVNDNVPQLKDFVIIFNNFRNHFPTGEVGRVPASDPDVNDMLSYHFISGNTANVLHLNEETGMIRLDSRLNSDVPTNGTLQVSVSDGINEVKATCRLFVRLVTEDMLYTSVTLRLNAITQTAFLSPLYHRFVAALASIIPTTEDNIYVINVNDDTDVSDKILNVSFSVRQKVENNRDVFYSPQFLRERVYLQRTLLAKLSTLEVLPFDDNLCVREPCLNFEECISILRFGNASSFIGSDTMLFRPIHPINAFACQCPRGFTGMEAEYLCDTEVNLCFSSPCGGNGTCQRHEGGYTCHCNTGFTGEHCEIDMKHKKYLNSCPADVCKSPSHCTSLIRGGFRCERCPNTGNVEVTTDSENSEEKFCIDCADMEHHTKFCELTTRSFPKGSFLMFPSLKRRHRFTIRMEFSTRQRNGLLFYNGRYNEMHDFVALEILDGQVQFSFSLGTHITRAMAHVEGGVNDGNWHEVTVSYFNRTATLTVGDYCDTEVAVRYGKMIGNYTCAAKTTQVLQDRCADITETCHRFLDLTGPLQIGGLPSLPTQFQVRNTDYVGCVRNIYIDDRFLDLNDYVWNNGTVLGCPQKRSFCLSVPCKNGGTCLDSWHTYQCRCPSGWGGKDCSQAIEPPRMLTGASYLTYTQGFPSIQLPWYNGIAFRTRQSTGLLMKIDMGPPNFVSIQIKNGLINYIHPERTVVLETVHVNDGKWHYLETRWLVGKLIVTLDYGQIQSVETMEDWVAGKIISRILVGGEMSKISGTEVVTSGLQGCVENVRVGNSPNSILTEPLEHNVFSGCSLSNPCDVNPCPANSYCYNHWQRHTCSCEIGYVGPQCESICSKWNPCKNGANCKPTVASSDGYVCECPHGYSGQYCENSIDHTCPATWWGTPICGPCNCPKDRGFNPSCNKTTGQCYCKENHYQPKDSNACFPCDCYSIGSWKKSCDAETGQCPCRNGVIGRRCDACSSRFAEVTLRGCEVVYDSCPRSFENSLWWDRTLFGEPAIQSCPQGTVGDASRLCTEEGWQKSDLFNCTSMMFVDLRKQIEQIEGKGLKVNTFVAKHLVSKLALATNETDRMYGMDINITYRILNQVLRHEERQAGLNLTHTQDRNFIQNLVDTVGRVLDPRYKPDWQAIHASAGGAADLMARLEGYGATLAHNMLQLFTQPFDAVHNNIVFGLDYVVKDNRTEVSVPKYNNKVQNSDMFDKETRVFIPSGSFSDPSMADMVVELVEGRKPTAVVSYVMYRTLGGILPHRFADDIRFPPAIPITVNTPVFSLNIIDGNKTIHGPIRQPIAIDFRQLGQENRTSPQCVYWRNLSPHPNNQIRGEWTSEGCKLKDRRDENHHKFITCECNHLSSFAVLMDISNVEYLIGGAVRMEPVTYTAVAVALLFLFAALLLFLVLRGLHSNNNSILINLVLSIFISNFLYIIGVTAVDAKMVCKVVSILLHYFFMCTFSWMFVATLHVYRMMTEIRNINQGAMKFYYVIGYVVPGIIVGLSVGLNTDAYGNQQFCWLRTTELIIWSFAGPICIVFVANVIVLIMAFFASCRAKQADPDFSLMRHSLRAAVVILPLLAMVWVFAVLAVNDNVVAFQYMYAACNVLLGVIFFLAHVIFNKRVRKEFKYMIQRLQGKKLDDTLGDTHTSVLSRSALAYHNDSSLDGGLNRMNVGISTTSTTSRSTSKSSGGLYRPDGYLGHSMSTSNSNNGPTSSHHYPPNAGIAPYGYDSSMFHDKPADDPDTGEPDRKRRAPARASRNRDSDSDSELSAVEHPDMDLASSHSSDDDDDVNFQWDALPKYKAVARVRGTPQVKPSAPPGGPIHSTPAPPPPYSCIVKSQWPGEGMSTTTASDTEVKSPEKIKISEVRPHADRKLPPIPGSPRTGSLRGSRDFMSPPERVDSLPSDTGKSTPRERIAVQVLTHNGSITSESETTSDSDSSDEGEQWA